MKLMLRDPIPLNELREKLQQFGIGLSEQGNDWLVQHADHCGLVLDKDSLYCRTCRSKQKRDPSPGK